MRTPFDRFVTKPLRQLAGGGSQLRRHARQGALSREASRRARWRARSRRLAVAAGVGVGLMLAAVFTLTDAAPQLAPSEAEAQTMTDDPEPTTFSPFPRISAESRHDRYSTGGVAFVDGDESTYNQYFVNSIYTTVTYTVRGALREGCTPRATEQWGFTANSRALRLMSEPAVLVDRPGGGDTGPRCDYNVRPDVYWRGAGDLNIGEPNSRHLILQTLPTATVNGGSSKRSSVYPDNPSASAGHEYRRSATFTLTEATISVPFIDEQPEDDVHDWSDVAKGAGNEIRLQIETRSTGSSAITCVVLPVIEVQVDAAETSAGSGLGTASVVGGAANVEFISQPSLRDHCRYNLQIPERFGTLTRTSDAVQQVGRLGGPDTTSFTATYEETHFVPNITVAVPDYDRDGEMDVNFFEGAEIPIMFTQTGGPADCPDTTELDYVVQDDGFATTDEGLLIKPDGEDDNCVYRASSQVTIDSPTNADPAWRLSRSTPEFAATDISATGPETALSLRYRGQTWFVPDFDFTLEHLDVDNDGAGDGIHDWTSYSTRFLSSIDATPSIHDDCGGDDITYDVVYTINDAGEPVRNSGVRGLLDRPMGQTVRCTYEADYSRTVRGDDWLELTSTEPMSFTFGAETEDTTYPDLEYGIRLRFHPRATIVVPQYDKDDGSGDNYFTGARFRVDFEVNDTDSPDGCNGEFMTFDVWEINAEGDSVAQFTDALTDAKPAGKSTPCVIDVTFANPVSNDGTPNDPSDPAYTLRRQPGHTMQLRPGGSAASRTATAAYLADQTTFTPRADITVPYVDTDGTTGNDLADAVITVEYEPVMGSDPSCTTGASQRHRVIDSRGAGGGGNLVHLDAAPDLVDRPEHFPDRCTYSATFTSSIGSGELETELATTNGALIDAITPPVAVYGAGTPFTPVIDLTLPDYQRDTDANKDFFEGEVFEMEFTLTTANNNCTTGTTMANYVVQDDGTLLPEDAEFELVDMPVGTTDRCQYDVEFPSLVSTPEGTSPGWTLTLKTTAPTPTESVNGDAATATAEYTAQTTFVPDVMISIPGRLLEVSSLGSNYQNAQLRVEFTRASTAAPLCSLPGKVTVRYVIQPNRDVLPHNSDVVPTLIDRLDNSATRCSYVARFETSRFFVSSPDYTLTLLGGHAARDASFDAASPSPSGAYHEGVFFVGGWDLGLPDYQRDGEPNVNFFEGAEFTTTVAPTTTSESTCTAGDTVWRLDGEGIPRRISGPVSFIEWAPGSGRSRCQYDLTIQETVMTPAGISPGWVWTLQATPAPPDPFHLRDRDINIDYHPVTNFIPPTMLTVPFINGGDGTHALKTQELEVTYARVGDDPNCTEEATDTFTIEAAAAEGGNATLTRGDLPVLTDRASNVVTPRCRYTVDFPDTVGSFARGTPDNQEFGADSADSIFDARYVGDIPFSPALTFMLPDYERDGVMDTDYFESTEFVVEFEFKTAGSPASGCSPNTSVTYEVLTNGNVAPTSFTPDGGTTTAIAPGESFSLISEPDGVEGNCVYVATFPDSVSTGASVAQAGTLTRLSGQAATTDVSAAAPAHTREYTASETNFTPDITVTVRDVEGLTPNQNLFTGTTFTVRLQRANTADTNCSAETAATLTYTVQSNHMVTTTDTVPELVDRPAGQVTRCVYNLAFESPKTSTSDAELTWTLERGTPTPSVNGGAREAIANYDYPAGVTYVPDVTITVPPYNGDDDPETTLDESDRNAFTGEQISVSFTSAEANQGCAPETFTYTIGATGTPTSDDTTKTLVAYAPGRTTLCTYTATFRMNEVDDGTRLARASVVPTTVTGLAQAIAASYLGTETRFAPPVTVVVPFVDTDSTPGNDLAGTEIEVRYRPAGAPMSQHDDCATTATETYTIATGGSAGAGGTAELTSAAASLVDRPAGEDDRCRYIADADDSFTLTGGEAVDIAPNSDNQEFRNQRPITVRYAGDVPFSPVLTFTLPDYERDGAPGTDYFASTEIVVTFALKTADSPATGCSSNTSVTYTTQTNGDVVPTSFTPEGGSATAIAPGGSLALIDQPEHASGNCVYVATFPDSVTTGTSVTPAGTLTRLATQDATADVSAAAPAHARTYSASESSFAPTVAITVPPTAGIATGGGTAPNLFAGTTFAVSFERVSAAHADCDAKTPIEVTYTVGANGTVTGTPPASLVDRPAGQTTRCVYDVTFESPRSADTELTWTLTLDTGATASVDGGELAATASYSVGEVTYVPDATIGVPQFMGDDNPDTTLVESSENAFVGEEISVEFSSTAEGCDDATLTYEVDAGGSVVLVPSPTTLVAYAASSTTPCDYTVAFPLNEDGAGTRLARQPNSSTSVTGVAQAIAADYENTQTNFAPDVTIAVPFVDVDATPDNMNDLAGSTIAVAYTLAGAPGSQHADCAATGSPETYTITAGGSATAGGTAELSSAAASLVDRPASQDARCRYVADFDDSFTPAGGEAIELGTDDEVEFIKTTELSATYAGETNFDVEVTLTVPDYDRDGAAGTNYFASTEIVVSFAVKTANSPAIGCSPTTNVTYEVRAANSVVPTSFTPAGGSETAIAAGDLPSLIDSPVGTTASCTYVATFPASVATGASVAPVGTLTLASGQDATVDVSARSNTAARRYAAAESSFAPTISITVPPVVGLTVGENLFAGTRFRVGIGAAVGAHADCSGQVGIVVNADYTVGTNGLVEGTPPASLVDRPAGEVARCAYRVVTLPQSPVPPSDAAVLRWQLQRGADRTTSISALAPDITAAYSVGAVTFSPVVTITVPPYDGDDDPATTADESAVNAFAGRTFEVSFAQAAGPATGCASATEIYEVDDEGVVAPQDGSPPVLTHFPDGDTSAACVYDVTYPPSSGAAPALVLATAGLDAATQAADTATGAGYLAAQTTFVPVVDPTVPYVDADGDNVNDIAGVEVSVTYTPVGSVPPQHRDCTTSATETYTVDDAGTVAAGGSLTLTSDAATLIDRPAGQTPRCRYEARFTAAISGGGQGPFDIAVNNLPFQKTVPVRPIWSGDTYFQAHLTLTVPQYDRDGGTGVNYYEGERFEVRFEVKAAGSPATGCSSPARTVYAVAANGDVEPQGGAPALIDTPEGMTGNCIYVATFPSSLSSVPGSSAPAAVPEWTLRLRASQTTTAEVSAASRTASRDYDADEISFVPVVALSVPPVLGIGAGGSAAGPAANLFAGTTFTVSIEREVGAHDECSLDAAVEVTFTVGADGMASGTPPASLVDRPAGQVARCEYGLTFAPGAASAAGAELTWALSLAAGAPAAVNGGSPSAAASYEVVVVTFVPSVAITVPTYTGDDDPDTTLDEATVNAFVGRTFSVEFARSAGPMNGCESASETYEVDDEGAVAPQDGSPPALTHLPVGETTNRCVYAVTFPPTVGAAPALELATAGLDDETRASARGAAASYEAAESTFAPAVSVALPFVDDGAGANRYAGLSVVFSYAALASGAGAGGVGATQPEGCTAAATETYTVESGSLAAGDGSVGGSAGLTSAAASLVDRPARSTARCRYVVTVSDATDELLAQLPMRELATSEIGKVDNAVAVTYEPAPVTPPTSPTVRPPATSGGSSRTGGSTRRPSGGGGGGASRTPSDDPPDEPADDPADEAPAIADGPFAGFVASTTRRVPVSVSVSQPERAFAPSDAFEVLVSAPGACGADITAFGGLPASVGVVFALVAESNAVSSLFDAGAFTWAEVAQRGEEQRSCALRVTLLVAPAGCRLSDPTTTADPASGDPAGTALTDDAGRSYLDVTWSEGDTSFTLNPSLFCADSSA